MYICIFAVDLASRTEKKSHEEGYFEPLPLQPYEKDLTQWAWIEQQMKASTSDYLLVAGHYPVYSACSHGNTATLIAYLKPLLEQYGAQYAAGHDHCMEHLAESGKTYIFSSSVFFIYCGICIC